MTRRGITKLSTPLANQYERSYYLSMQAQSKTRSRILDQGVDLLSVVGLGGITIARLADKLGMSKSGLFAHFRSKEAVQIALLEHAAALADAHVVAPAMRSPAGLPRLRALIGNWLGWARRAGLAGGCPGTAGLFELDDVRGDTRNALTRLEAHWRDLLTLCTQEAVGAGHLDGRIDVDQFVWELSGIYLSHHASVRFIGDPAADRRAQVALDALFERAAPRPKA